MKPDASNTGPRTEPTIDFGGRRRITEPGLYEGFYGGHVIIEADDVHLRDFRLNPKRNQDFTIDNRANHKGLVVEYGEILGAKIAGVGYDCEALRYCNIWDNGQDGAKLRFSDVVEWNYIHHVGWNPTAHADGIQMLEGRALIQRNNIDVPIDTVLNGTTYKNSSALMLNAVNGELTAVVVENWLNGGSTTVQIRNKGYPLVMCDLGDNRFGPDRQYKPWIVDNVVVYGNRWEATGELIEGQEGTPDEPDPDPAPTEPTPQPAWPPIRLTARDSGYYLVIRDGVQISQHTTEREAIQRADEERRLGKTTIEHSYVVDVE